MNAEDFVKWLRGYIEGVEITAGGSWSALEGIKKKLPEVTTGGVSVNVGPVFRGPAFAQGVGALAGAAELSRAARECE
jgi:hypothetical protein